jgi:hypothetical protein
VTALNDSRDEVTRIALHPDSWDPRPDEVTVDGRSVRLDWLRSVDPYAVGVTRGAHERLELLVVPPHTRMTHAAAAMAAACASAGELRPSDILRSLSVVSSAGTDVEAIDVNERP